MGIEIIDLAALPKSEQALCITTIANWAKDAWSKYRPERKTLDDWKIQEPQLGKPPITLVAFDTNDRDNKRELVGVVMLNYNNLEGALDKNVYRLSSLYVEEKHRNKGISLKLINGLAHIAREHQAESIWLFTHEQEEFYKKLGWDFRKRQKMYNADAAILQGDIGVILDKLKTKLDASIKSESISTAQHFSFSMR